MAELQHRLALWLWLAAYSLEESRERHAAHERHVRSALCSLGLAVIAFERGAA